MVDMRVNSRSTSYGVASSAVGRIAYTRIAQCQLICLSPSFSSLKSLSSQPPTTITTTVTITTLGLSYKHVHRSCQYSRPTPTRPRCARPRRCSCGPTGRHCTPQGKGTYHAVVQWCVFRAYMGVLIWGVKKSCLRYI